MIRHNRHIKKFHSTETDLLKVQNDILESLDNGCATALIMLDLSATFDTIDHQMLLNCLNCVYGLIDKALMWVKSYLSECYQMVTVERKQSRLMLLDYWYGLPVPQGSVLSPKKYNTGMYTGP